MTTSFPSDFICIDIMPLWLFWALQYHIWSYVYMHVLEDPGSHIQAYMHMLGYHITHRSTRAHPSFDLWFFTRLASTCFIALAYLGDTAGSIPDHHNQVSTTIKTVVIFIFYFSPTLFAFHLKKIQHPWSSMKWSTIKPSLLECGLVWDL